MLIHKDAENHFWIQASSTFFKCKPVLFPRCHPLILKLPYFSPNLPIFTKIPTKLMLKGQILGTFPQKQKRLTQALIVMLVTFWKSGASTRTRWEFQCLPYAGSFSSSYFLISKSVALLVADPYCANSATLTDTLPICDHRWHLFNLVNLLNI